MVDQDARACVAPHSALYLDPSGLVTACCANSSYVLGRISDGEHSDSLRSIWNGDRAQSLRAALARADFSLGCHECARGASTDGQDTTLAREFDRFRGTDDRYPAYLDLALSNTCNLQCVMCNGDLSSAIRSRREGRPPLRSPYGDRFFEELAEFLPHVDELSFKGGEPFLSHEAIRVWDLLLDADLRPRITVTTNGTVWNDRVERYLSELGMGVSISIDGATAETVEAIRVGADHARLWRNVRRMRAITEESGATFVLNYCLMPQNVGDFGAFLSQADALDVDVHVVPVVAPRGYDLLVAGAEVLTALLASLEEEGKVLELGRNLGVWRAELARIRRAVGQPAPATPVQLLPTSAQLAALRSDLERQSGAALLELVFDDGVLRTVHSPPWADSMLRPGEWVGSGEHDLPARIADALGLAFPEIRATPRDGISMDAVLRFEGTDGHDGTVELRAVSLTDRRTGRPSRLLICAPSTQFGGT